MFKTVSFNEETKKIWAEALTLNDLNVPFLTYDWHKSYFETIGTQEKPLILYDAEHSTIIPLTERNSGLFFSGEQEVSDYQDSIGPKETKAVVWQSFLDYLRDLGTQKVRLTNIPENSPTLSFFKDLESKNYTVQLTQRDTTPKIDLPASYDEYLTNLSRKDRHEVRRKQRRFHEDHPNSEIKICDEVPNDFEILIRLMKLDGRKMKFFTPEFEAFFRTIPKFFSPEILLQILCIDQIPATAIMAFTIGSSLYLYNSGFDQEHYPGAGFYLKAESVKYAIEKGFKEYNFLRGNERYKYELGGKNFGVYDIIIQKK